MNLKIVYSADKGVPPIRRNLRQPLVGFKKKIYFGYCVSRCFRVPVFEELVVLSFGVLLMARVCVVVVSGERGREDGPDPGRAPADVPREAPPHLRRPTEGGGKFFSLVDYEKRGCVYCFGNI